MLAAAIIDRKREGQALTPAEIQFMVAGLTDGSVPDYQISAWAMAILFQGMSAEETASLTDAMLASGSRLARVTDRPRLDKHSTGGLGDKVSLVLAPLLACLEVDVPMLSGRGLGITGGTLDKLEAYAGFRSDLSASEIERLVERLGCVITGTTPDIAPADRKLYALRDVTGTVPSIPLITASIMSKKLAATLDALVLDVKWGSGAFMPTLDQARQLASSLMQTGQRLGVPTVAILSDMNQPLGRMVGNACEANEAVEVLRGAGPADVRQLTLRLGAEVLVACGRFPQLAQATAALAEVLNDGRGLQRFQAMVEGQGGRFEERIHLAVPHVWTASQSGFVARVDGQQLGRAVIEMGGGRRQQGDSIDHRVGLETLVRLGDYVERGQPLAKYFCAAPAAREQATQRLPQVWHFSEAPVAPLPLIVSEEATAVDEGS